MKCAIHSDVETNLRCGKCDKPICPRCMVQTPVGARCRDCARLYTLPTYRVSATHYLRATGAASGMAIICGFIWGIIAGFIPFFYLNLLIASGVGYAIGEVTSLSVNRKRGRMLATIAGIAVALSYLVSIFSFGGLPFGLLHIVLDLAAVILGVFFAINRFR
ncbi:B-box zinc finger protein [Chloroflexota bacterium]